VRSNASPPDAGSSLLDIGMTKRDHGSPKPTELTGCNLTRCI
jgi:hypothetical protein